MSVPVTFPCSLDSNRVALPLVWEHTVGSCHAPLARALPEVSLGLSLTRGRCPPPSALEPANSEASHPGNFAPQAGLASAP
jgi:hypothetical protein